MKQISFLSLYLLALCSLFASTQAAAANKEPRKGNFNAEVGRFQLGIDDDRLNTTGVLFNQTLMAKLHRLSNNVQDYWYSYCDVPPDNNTEHDVLQQKSRNILYPLVNTTRWKQTDVDALIGHLSSAAATLMDDFYDGEQNKTITGYDDLVSYYLDAIQDEWSGYAKWRWGFLLGVGKTVSCSAKIDTILEDKPEWEKLGMSTAATLMALVPTILAFGTLYVPRSSELFSTSYLVGLSTSIYSLGLPVASLSIVRDRRKIDVYAFTLRALSVISSLGHGISKKETVSDKMDKLRSWTAVEDDETGNIRFWAEKNAFKNIRIKVDDWQQRWHWWQIPSLFIAAAQVVMFVVAVAPLLQDLGVPRFMFDCHTPGQYTGWYLGISATVNAVVRLILWEFGDHERVKVFSLSESARKALQEMVDFSHRLDLSLVASQAPPLHRPLSAKTRHGLMSIGRSVGNLLGCYKRGTAPGSSQDLDPEPDSVRASTKRLARGMRDKTMFGVRNMDALFAGGFGWRSRQPAGGARGHSTRSWFTVNQHHAGRRYRPLIVLVHLSTEARSLYRTLFTGFIEAVLLLVLTFFFAAQWGGNLIITLIAMCILLLFVTAGRVLGFIYMHISLHVWDLHVVNCDDGDQVKGSLSILCAMSGVLVNVNGAYYFEGTRVDHSVEFDSFKKRWDRGELDRDDVDDEDSPRTDGFSNKGQSPGSAEVGKNGSNGREVQLRDLSREALVGAHAEEA